jgi:hypothetical protein
MSSLPPPAPFPIRSIALITLALMLCLLVLSSLRPPIAPVWDDLHQPEWSAQGMYRWSYPLFSLTQPFARMQPAVLVTQRLNAGPTNADTRLLQITSAGQTTAFTVIGGGPARVYRYVLPTNGHALDAVYRVSRMPSTPPSEERPLGLVLYLEPAVQIAPLKPAPVPSLVAPGAALLVPLSLLALSAWGVRRWFVPIALANSLLVLTLCLIDPIDLLHPDLLRGIWIGLLIISAAGALITRLVRSPHWADLVLAFCVAAVTLPLIYLGNGLWSNLGHEWDNLRPLLVLLLSAPFALALGALYLPWHAQRPWIAGSAAIAVSLFGLWNLLNELALPPYDFTIYWQAAQRFQQGQPIYETALLTRTPFAVYKYHPIFLGFILPLTSFSAEQAALIWRIIQFSAMLAGAGLILLSFFRTQSWIWLTIGVLLLSFSPITLSIRLGQIDGLLLLLIAAAVSLAHTQRHPLSGIAYSVIGILKVYPALIMIADLVQRRWRVILTTISSGVFLILASLAWFGWHNELAFWREVVPSLSIRTIRLSNQSLYGLIGRTLYPNLIDSGNLGTELPLVTALHLLASLIIGAITAWAIWRISLRRNLARFHLDVACLLICTILLVIPVSWDHYQVLLLLPLLAACALAWQHNHQRVLLLSAFTLLAYGTYKQISVNLIASDLLLFLVSYRTFGLLILWFWWITLAHTENHSSGAIG